MKHHKRLVIIIVLVLVVLLVPLIAMRFTEEVNWSAMDFLIAGILLFGTGLVCELVIKKVTKTRYRRAICALILLVLVFVWTELAVGIIGTPFAGN